MDESGVRWKMMSGLVGASTRRTAIQRVSPVSEVALHEYDPGGRKGEREGGRDEYSNFQSVCQMVGLKVPPLDSRAINPTPFK